MREVARAQKSRDGVRGSAPKPDSSILSPTFINAYYSLNY